MKKDRAYDEAYEISAQIEDKIGAGAGLSDIAKEMNVKIYDVQGLTEDGKARKEPAAYAALLKSNDFVDTAFHIMLTKSARLWKQTKDLWF